MKLLLLYLLFKPCGSIILHNFAGEIKESNKTCENQANDGLIDRLILVKGAILS